VLKEFKVHKVHLDHKVLHHRFKDPKDPKEPLVVQVRLVLKEDHKELKVGKVFRGLKVLKEPKEEHKELKEQQDRKGLKVVKVLKEDQQGLKGFKALKVN
jgi:uncharacterized protein YwbE